MTVHRVEQLSALLLLTVLAPPARCLLLSNEDRPSLIDRVLQVVWEPSSLIRLWVGLDQLYNIALSWRGVAKSVTSLPFGGEGRSENHVRIQQPRSLKYHHQPSVASQWDRFNEIYASSDLSPIFNRAGRSHRAGGNPVQTLSDHVFFGDSLRLPASVLSQKGLFVDADAPSRTFGAFMGDQTLSPQQQNIFLGPDTAKSSNELHPFGNGEDSLVASKLLHFQDQQHSGGALEASSHPKRLTSFLGLLKTLGGVHAGQVLRHSLENSDH